MQNFSSGLGGITTAGAVSNDTGLKQLFQD